MQLVLLALGALRELGFGHRLKRFKRMAATIAFVFISRHIHPASPPRKWLSPRFATCEEASPLRRCSQVFNLFKNFLNFVLQGTALIYRFPAGLGKFFQQPALLWR